MRRDIHGNEKLDKIDVTVAVRIFTKSTNDRDECDALLRLRTEGLEDLRAELVGFALRIKFLKVNEFFRRWFSLNAPTVAYLIDRQEFLLI